jgi:hypothetical protein
LMAYRHFHRASVGAVVRAGCFYRCFHVSKEIMFWQQLRVAAVSNPRILHTGYSDPA